MIGVAYVELLLRAVKVVLFTFIEMLHHPGASLSESLKGQQSQHVNMLVTTCVQLEHAATTTKSLEIPAVYELFMHGAYLKQTSPHFCRDSVVSQPALS